MVSTVGAKGEVVIEEALREQLGVQPGWRALQVVLDNHLRIYFVPLEHEESLLGAARRFGTEGIQSITVAPVMHGARCSGPTTSPPVSRLR